MPAKPQPNPGATPGTQIVSIQTPFDGWVSSVIEANNLSGGNHYGAAVEGNEEGLTGQTKNQYSESDGVTLFRNERLGHLSAAQCWTPVSDTNGYVTSLPLNGATASSDASAIVVLRNGRIVKMPAFQGNISAKYDPNGGTTLDTNLDNDLLVLKDVNPSGVQEWVVWSWESSLKGDIAIAKAADFSSPTDSWFSGLATSYSLVPGVPHKLCLGPDGNIYVTNGNNVEQIVVGTGGALNAGGATKGLELTLGSGWTAVGIASYKNYVAIIATSNVNSNVSRGQVRVFLWNGESTTVGSVTLIIPQYVYDIPDSSANGLFFDGNILWAITSGRNLSTKIWEFSSKGFVKAFETALYPPLNSPLQGSMESYQDAMMMGMQRFALPGGARLTRFYRGGFHDEGPITDGTYGPTLIGMVKNLQGGVLFVGTRTGATNAYCIVYNNPVTYQPGAVFRSVLYSLGLLGRRMYPLGFKGTVNRIKIYLSQWGTGASLTLSLFKDYAAAGVGGSNDLLNLVIDTTKYPAGTAEIDLTGIDQGMPAITDISDFYMIITWSHSSPTATAAIIRRIEVHVDQSQ